MPVNDSSAIRMNSDKWDALADHPFMGNVFKAFDPREQAYAASRQAALGELKTSKVYRSLLYLLLDLNIKKSPLVLEGIHAPFFETYVDHEERRFLESFPSPVRGKSVGDVWRAIVAKSDGELCSSHSVGPFIERMFAIKRGEFRSKDVEKTWKKFVKTRVPK